MTLTDPACITLKPPLDGPIRPRPDRSAPRSTPACVQPIYGSHRANLRRGDTGDIRRKYRLQPSKTPSQVQKTGARTSFLHRRSNSAFTNNFSPPHTAPPQGSQPFPPQEITMLHCYFIAWAERKGDTHNIAVTDLVQRRDRHVFRSWKRIRWCFGSNQSAEG